MTSSQSVPRWETWLDRFGLVAILAFTLGMAAVPARNPDLFAALGASGMSGSWLYDLTVQTAHRLAPTWGVVLLKGLTLAGFVALGIIACVQRGLALRWALYGGFLLGLAVLPFAAVEPFLLTLIFSAAIVVLFAWRPWSVLVVALLWANMAEGAILAGYLVAGLMWEARRSKALLVATVLVVFITPEPLRAVRLPGLTDVVLPVFRPEGFAALRSPLTFDFWKRSAGYESFLLAGACALLLPLLLALRWRHFAPRGLVLVWLGTAGLMAAHWKFVPLLVLAGTVLSAAILGQRASERRELRSSRWTSFAALLTMIWGLILPLIAWVGWLQAPPYAARSWAVEPEPSLQAMARTLATQDVGTIFPLSTAAADHLAYTTTHRLAYTSRSNLATLRDAETVARALTEMDRVWNEDARVILRQTQTTHLVLFHTERQRFAVALAKILGNRSEFPVLYWHGRAIVVGWRDPRAATPTTYPHVLDLEPESTASEWRVPAPETGPERVRFDRWWRDAFTQRPAPRTADRDEATVSLMLFEHQRLQRAQANPVAYEAHMIAGLIAAGTTPGQVPLRMEMALARYFADPNTGRPASTGGRIGVMYYGPMQQRLQEGSLGTLLRGVRAARRAIATNPRDAAAYHALGECYLRIHHFTTDRTWGEALPPLERVRLAQVAHACRQALLLDPQLIAAHRTLVQVYLEQRYFDAALTHLEEVAKATRIIGVLPEESEAVFQERLKLLEEQLDRLRKQVTRGEEALTEVAGARPYDRAATAFNNGLPQQALAILLASDISAFGKDGLQLEVNLLISLGRADDAAEWLTPDLQDLLSPVTFRSLRWQALATVGHYRDARLELEALFDLAEPTGTPPRAGAGRLVGLLFADACHVGQNHITALLRERNRLLWRIQAVEILSILSRQADVYTQLAWLTFEQGDFARADDYATQALTTAGTQAFAGRPVAEAIQQLAHP